MRFGVCGGVSQASQIAAAGYDYIELSVAGELIPDEDDAAWAEKRTVLEAMPLTAEAFNIFVGKGKITGPEADFERLERYVNNALSRAAQIGGKVIVFGSGGARKVPEGFPVEEAERQIVRFLNLCADASDHTGVLIAIEPLGYGETNIINTIADGARFVHAVDRPGVRNLADTYHMEQNAEPITAISEFGGVLAHAHTADTKRIAPGFGEYDHVAMFRQFRAASYDQRLSIECTWEDFAAQLGPALAHLKAAYTVAGAE